jgi:hypothetical protein
MQFTTFLTTAVILAMASSGLAACTYEQGNYSSVCNIGNNLFCGGMTGICSSGQTEDFDDTATKANEESCKGLTAGNGCTQTVRCC